MNMTRKPATSVHTKLRWYVVFRARRYASSAVGFSPAVALNDPPTGTDASGWPARYAFGVTSGEVAPPSVPVGSGVGSGVAAATGAVAGAVAGASAPRVGNATNDATKSAVAQNHGARNRRTFVMLAPDLWERMDPTHRRTLGHE
jgi:hypothetical protein